ncbi:sulfate transporter, partial [Trifolium medium]|nr:sulfate transporter [Trifolium medium]
RSQVEDLTWARQGVVATVLNGESVPLVQQRIEDGGFLDLVLTPLGADKVVLHIRTAEDVMCTINSARQFFDYFFSSFVRWDKEIVPFQRGAWLRLYGIMLHAWNENFFKLCVLDCGRYLCTDTSTLEKESLDSTRVLVATPSLEVLNVVANLLIDGVMVEVKLIEEWGYNIGEDVCLLEEDVTPRTNYP